MVLSLAQPQLAGFCLALPSFDLVVQDLLAHFLLVGRCAKWLLRALLGTQCTGTATLQESTGEAIYAREALKASTTSEYELLDRQEAAHMRQLLEAE